MMNGRRHLQPKSWWITALLIGCSIPYGSPSCGYGKGGYYDTAYYYGGYGGYDDDGYGGYDDDGDEDYGSDCTVCEACSTDSDCGSNGVCISFDGVSGICTMDCSTDGSCPGDSACFGLEDVDGNQYAFCLNPDADTVGACEGSWTCE